MNTPTTSSPTQPTLNQPLRRSLRRFKSQSKSKPFGLSYAHRPYRWSGEELGDSPLRHYVAVLPLFF